MSTTNTFRLLAAVAVFTCNSTLAAQDQVESRPLQESPKPNLLILIADDLGVDYVSAYGEGPDPAKTPNIDALADRGVLFRNAWASPVCSPTRACIHTGRYSFRTGIGAVLRGGNGGRRGRRGGGRGRRPGTGGAVAGLPLSELTLPELLDKAGSGYSHAAIGKWHLGAGEESRGPNQAGWSHFAGSLSGSLRGENAYFNWQRTVNGATEVCRTYATTMNVDDTLDWIEETEQAEKPWLCYLSFNAPHAPFHNPPNDLHEIDASSLAARRATVPQYRAMVEAMDREIGRLLRGLGEARDRTNVIFMGDNGTPGQVAQTPFLSNHAKGSLYEGGVNVPLIVAGPIVKTEGRETSALVSATDIFSTAAELCGVSVQGNVPRDLQIDGLSFVPILSNAKHPTIRSTVFSESFRGSNPAQNGRAAIRGPRYKVVREYRAGSTTDEFYDLESDPFEQTKLLWGDLNGEQQAEITALCAEMDRLRSSARDTPR